MKSKNVLSYWWLFLLVLIIANVTVFMTKQIYGSYESSAYFIAKLGELDPDQVPAYLKAHLDDENAYLDDEAIIIETKLHQDYGLYYTKATNSNREKTINEIKTRLAIFNKTANEMRIEPSDKIQELIDLSLKFAEQADGKITLVIKPVDIETMQLNDNLGPFVAIGNIKTVKRTGDNSLIDYLATNFILILVTYSTLILWHNRGKILDLNIWLD